MDKQTPILIIVFNRPKKAQALIESLSKIKPRKLYVAADGPRNETDKIQCDQVKEIVENINWECDVHKKYSQINLGLSQNMEEAIDWLFSENETGIIFEDDCIPNEDFFRFANEMLERYKDNEDIMLISGTNYQQGHRRGNASYFFSKYSRIWGWATWRRSWSLYRKGAYGMDEFIKNNELNDIFPDKKESGFWLKAFTNPYTDRNGKTRLTWATTWHYSVLKNRGLTIVPNVNLVQNIGYGEDSTHTRGSGRGWSFKTEKLGEIIHPDKIEVNEEADRYYYYTQHHKTIFDKIYNDLNVFLDKIGLKPLLIKILKLRR